VNAHPKVSIKNVERDLRSRVLLFWETHNKDTLRGTEDGPTAEEVSEEWSIQRLPSHNFC